MEAKNVIMRSMKENACGGSVMTYLSFNNNHFTARAKRFLRQQQIWATNLAKCTVTKNKQKKLAAIA